MIRVFIEDSFDSAHFLPNVPDGHKCKNLHGHTYKIRLEVEGDIDPVLGWVADYSDLKRKWEVVKIRLDHKQLNEIGGLENSTCEILAYWIAKELKPSMPALRRIEIRETERCGVVLDTA